MRVRSLLFLCSFLCFSCSTCHAGKVVLNCIEQHSQTHAYVYAADDDEDKNKAIIAVELERFAGKRDENSVEYKLNCEAGFEITINIKQVKQGGNSK